MRSSWYKKNLHKVRDRIPLPYNYLGIVSCSFSEERRFLPKAYEYGIRTLFYTLICTDIMDLAWKNDVSPNIDIFLKRPNTPYLHKYAIAGCEYPEYFDEFCRFSNFIPDFKAVYLKI